MTLAQVTWKFTLAESRNLFFVKHDYQMNPLPDRFNKWDSDPEVVGTYYDRKIKVTTEMNRYMRGILRLFCPNLSDVDFEKSYRSLMADGTKSGAFCNFAGIDSPDWSWEELLCGGATLQAVTGEIVRMGGKDYIEVYALNANNVPATPLSVFDVDMTLHFRPTVFTHEKLPDGSYKVWAFPQFDDKSVVPLWSKSDTLFVPAERLVSVLSVQNPFNPEFTP